MSSKDIKEVVIGASESILLNVNVTTALCNRWHYVMAAVYSTVASDMYIIIGAC